MNCLFCEIIQKQKEAKIIYEDGAVVAILDVFPHAPGHTLVLPKRHVKNIFDLSEEELGSVFAGVKNVAALLARALAPEGFTIGINHGEVGGQAIEHMHIHIMPRFTGDGGGSIHSVVKNPPVSIEEIYQKIVAKK